MRKLFALLSIAGVLLVSSSAQDVRRIRHRGGAAPPVAGTPFVLTQTLGTLRNNATICVGLLLAATANNNVTALQRWKVAGNSGSHLCVVALETGGDTGTVLQSCTVNTAIGTAGTYNECAITIQAIASGSQYYFLCEEAASGDQWYDNDTVLNTFTTGIGTVQGAAGATGAGCTSGFFSNSPGTNKSYVPVNFKVQ